MKNKKLIIIIAIVALLLIGIGIALFVMLGSGENTGDIATPTPEATASPNPDHTHTFGDWATTKAPTCVEKGEQERVCSCGDKETQELDLVPHTEVVDSAVEATCDKTGLTEGMHCSVCNAILIAQEEVPLKAHTY
ncbi:MAG: hypothetical protein IKV30_07035, partial [Clostridia bacterium]|nr:hypothetical protein [Clostridia bacterium]